MKAKNFYLVIRGKKSAHHKAPYHPIILCTRRHTADWESHRTSEGHTVIVCMAPDSLSCSNWLVVKYKGYDIDYRTVTANFKLFDGKRTNEVSARSEIDKYLKKAVWFSYDDMPDDLKNKGVKYAKDDFTKARIWEDTGTLINSSSQYNLCASVAAMDRLPSVEERKTPVSAGRKSSFDTIFKAFANLVASTECFVSKLTSPDTIGVTG